MEEIEIREGWLLGHQLRKARGSMSFAAAAREAGFAKQTWWNTELGQKPIPGGGYAPYTPSEAVVRAAARAVGLDPDKCVALAVKHAPARPVLDARRGAPKRGKVQRLLDLATNLGDDDLDALLDLAKERTDAQRAAEAQAAKRRKR